MRDSDDLRFPELYQKLTFVHGAQVLLIPSAFAMKTGEAHWEARAKDSNQYSVDERGLWCALRRHLRTRGEPAKLSASRAYPVLTYGACALTASQTLLRARAIENQCYVIAAAQVRVVQNWSCAVDARSTRSRKATWHCP